MGSRSTHETEDNMLATIYKHFKYEQTENDINDMFNLLWDHDPSYTIKMLIVLVNSSHFPWAINWFINTDRAKHLLKSNLECIKDQCAWKTFNHVIYPLLHDSYFRPSIIHMIAQQLEIDIINMQNGQPISSCVNYAPRSEQTIDNNPSIVHYICLELSIDMSNIKKGYKTYRYMYINPLFKYSKLLQGANLESIFAGYEDYTTINVNKEIEWNAMMKNRITYDNSISVSLYINKPNLKFEVMSAMAHLSHCTSSFCNSMGILDGMHQLPKSLIKYIEFTETHMRQNMSLDTVLNTLISTYCDVDMPYDSNDIPLAYRINQGVFPQIIYVFSQEEYTINVTNGTLAKYKYTDLPIIVNILMTKDIPIVTRKVHPLGGTSITVITISGWSSTVRDLLLSDQEITNQAIIKKEFDNISITKPRCSIM